MERTPFEKYKSEIFSAGIDFTGHLPTGRTLATGTIKAYFESGNEATGTLILASPTLTIDSVNNLASAALGVNTIIGKFTLAFTVVLDNGHILHEKRFLYVRE